MTRRLYYEDAYIREFDARVTKCRKAEGGYEVFLDRTAFYPEGGGQPCDLGALEPVEPDGKGGGSMSEEAETAGEEGRAAVPDGETAGEEGRAAVSDGKDGRVSALAASAAGSIPVTDVQERGGEVVHLCSRPVEAGTRVRGKIDWPRRLTHMREHSGEHILSGIICGTYGCSNIGFHMGKDFVTVDFSVRLTRKQVREAEEAANEKVLENVEILADYPSAEELKALDYRSKKELEGAVRIVTIQGADCCACCGTHVRRTGEIGPIKVIADEHYKSGIRLTLLIGKKALADYAQKFENTAHISALLSVKPEHTAEGVEKLLESMNALKLEYGALKMRLLEQKVDAVENGQEAAVLFEEGLSAADVRRLADRLQEKAGFAAVFCGDDADGYKYVMISAKTDISAFGKEFNAALGGRGGGRNPMIQGSVAAGRREIEAFLAGRGLL